ncbi:MAG: cyanophycin synthetase, partial [Spirochaetaceae bacterium]|nr:cyanophycin synthetase [Spirochaetaceae bacterium]
RFDFPLPGRHALLDAIAAMAVAERVGTSPRDVADGLSEAKPLFGRGEIVRGKVTLVRDCYNANPDSVLAAMGFCDGLSWKGRRAYVLGSMLELGNESESAHRAMGEAAGRSRALALFFFGDETRPAFESARSSGFKGMVVHETDFDRLRAILSSWAREGDLVLLKGSRGMELERLSDSLASAAETAIGVPSSGGAGCS